MLAILFIAAGILLGLRLTTWFSSINDLIKRAAISVVCGFSILLLLTYGFALGFSELSELVILFSSVLAIIFTFSNRFYRNIDWRSEWLKTDKVILATVLVFVFYFTAMNLNGTISWHGSDYRGSHTMWGDYGMHMSIASSFAYAKNFPPTYAISPGTPLGYSFMADFFAAILMVGGLHIGPAFQLSNVILFIGLLGSFLFLAYSLLRSRSAVLLFLFLFMFNSTIGSLQAINDVVANPEVLFHPSTDYTLKFDGDSQHVWSSTLVSFFFPQRGFLLGFAVAALVVYAFFEESKNRSKRFWVLLGVLLGSLAYAHSHSLLAAAVIVIVLTLMGALQNLAALKKELNAARKSMERKQLLSALPAVLQNAMASYYLRPLASLLIIGVFALLIGGPQLAVTSTQGEDVPNFSGPFVGWLAINQGKGLLDLAAFYLIALWIPLWLGSIGCFTTKSAQLRKLFIAAFVVFIIANVYKFQGWDWDNNKLIFYFFFAACLLGAEVLASLRMRPFGTLAVCAILLFSSAGALLDNVFYYNLTYTIFTPDDLEFAEWVKDNTQPRDVFATGTGRYPPAAVLAGRPAIAAGNIYWWGHGLNTPRMEATLSRLKSFYKNPSCDLLSGNNFSYVAVTPHEAEYGPDVVLLDNAPFLKKVYDKFTDEGRYVLYRVSCNE